MSTTQEALAVSHRDAERVYQCPTCERRRLFGVVLARQADGSYRCDECGSVWEPALIRLVPEQDLFEAIEAEREEDAAFREVWREETSRRGRYVPDSATGGEATGASKPPVNPFKWMRRGGG